MSNSRVIYSDDVSIVDHANMVVYKDLNGDLCAIYISRNEETEQVLIYTIELFSKPSESWLDADEIKSFNSSVGIDYQFDKPLKDIEQYLFSADLCWYYGPENFDSQPNQVHFNDLEKFLTGWGVLKTETI